MVGQLSEAQAWAAAGRADGDPLTLTVRRRRPPAGWETLELTGTLRAARSWRSAEGRPLLAPGRPGEMEHDGFASTWSGWYERAASTWCEPEGVTSTRRWMVMLTCSLAVVGCGHQSRAASTSTLPAVDKDYLAFCAENPGACPPRPARAASPAPSERAEIGAARRRAARPKGVPAVPATQRCRSASIALSLGEQISPETGEHGIIVRLTNHGPPCSLAGYPRVAFYEGRRRLPFRVVRGGRYGTGGTPRRVRLRRGGHAYFIAAKYRCDGQTLHGATAARVRLPRMTVLLRLEGLGGGPGVSDVSYCRAYSGPSRADPGNLINLSPISTRAHLFAPG
jgi:hypothetical protein